MRCLIAILFAGAVAALAPTAPALASSTGLWKQETLLNFYDGKFADTVITDNGEITLGNVREEILATTDAFIWELLDDGRGSLWAGSGNKAVLYRIPLDGGPVHEWALPGLGVNALAMDAKGRIYAGGFPKGEIFRFDPKTNEKTSFSQLGEKYIWDMKFGKDGTLYAVTGSKARLYKIDAEGAAEKVFESGEKHFLSLALNDAGNFFIGSSPSGYLYMADAEGKASVLHDFEEEEVYRVLLNGRGRVFAAANFVQPSDKNGKDPIAREEPLTFPLTATGKRAENSLPASLYEVDLDSRIRRLLQAPDPYIFSLEWLSENVMAVGTGMEGHFYKVHVDDETATLAQLPGMMALSMTASDGALFVGTGNPASIFKISAGYNAEGTYTSVVNDLNFRTLWGSLDARVKAPEGASIAFRTRSGNTEKPDETWSDWSEPVVTLPFKVANPPGRFIQYEAKFATENPEAAPTMKDFRLSFLSDNQKPRIVSLTVNPQPARFEPAQAPGAAGGQPGGASPHGGGPGDPPRQPQTNLRVGTVAYSPFKEIVWDCYDQDQDQLEYALWFRKTSSPAWSLIDDELQGPKYNWPIGDLTDGEYEIKLLANDSRDNPADRALEDEEISETFRVDNTPPGFMDFGVSFDKENRAQIAGTVSDAISNVAFLQYAVDDLEWNALFPSDLIFDSQTEMVSFSAGPLKSGDHTILLRAKDSLGNVGSHELNLTAP